MSESFTNPNGGVTTYTYDQNQNVTSETVGDYYHVEYAYNGANRVQTTKNSRGQTASYEYDKAGRDLNKIGKFGESIGGSAGKGKVVGADIITATYDNDNSKPGFTGYSFSYGPGNDMFWVEGHEYVTYTLYNKPILKGDK